MAKTMKTTKEGGKVLNKRVHRFNHPQGWTFTGSSRIVECSRA